MSHEPRDAMPRTLLTACLAAMLGTAPLNAQVLHGSVRDSVRLSPIANALLTVRDSRDSTRCTSTSNAAGRFRCLLAGTGQYTVALRHLGHAPRVFNVVVAPTTPDSLELPVELAPTATLLDTVRADDTVRMRRFLGMSFGIAPGHIQFREHMALGKGNFIAGQEVVFTGLSLSQYLLSHFGDSLQIMRATGVQFAPGVPVEDGGVLLSRLGGRCLYVRINRLNVAVLLKQQMADDIDELIPVNDVRGIELYLSYEDIPEEWRAEAYPTGVVKFQRRHGGSIAMGDIGRQRVTRTVAANAPKCPFLQIWTSNAW